MAPAPAVSAVSEVPVFTETSLGTRVALSALSDITAAEFKRKLETEYASCFPESGPVRVLGVMVKRQSLLYYLPDSMPIKYIFHGSSKAWFLHVDLSLSDDLSCPCSQDCIATNEVWYRSLEPSPLKHQRNALHSKEEEGTKSPLESCHLDRVEENECEPENRINFEPMDDDTCSGSSSEAISVGGIIKRYFSPNDMVSCSTGPISKARLVHSRAKSRRNSSEEFAVKTPPRPINDSLREGSERSRVGKRLVTASYLLGVSPSKNTVPSLCKSRNSKFSSRCSSGVRFPVFEISGSSDEQSNS